MKKLLYIIIYLQILSIMISCIGKNKEPSDIYFGELDKVIQDSLLKLNSRIFVNYNVSFPTLIDFSNRCELVRVEIGPWIVSKYIIDTISKRKIEIPRNAPDPYIVYDDYVYYPHEYNLLVMGFDKNSLFHKVYIK